MEAKLATYFYKEMKLFLTGSSRFNKCDDSLSRKEVLISRKLLFLRFKTKMSKLDIYVIPVYLVMCHFGRKVS